MSTMPLRVGCPERRCPLHGVAATRAIESRATAVLPAHALMVRAGWAVARCALALAPHARHVWVAAGPGNNGGDGIEAAVHLQAVGKQVTVTLLGDPQLLPADARAAWHKAQQTGVSFGPTPAQVDLVIDGLLGIGGAMDRPLSAPMLQMVEAINAFSGIRLAIDLPSGLSADTGNVHAASVCATHTISLLTLKPGLFTAQGRDHAGDIWFDNLQVEPASTEATAWLEGREITSAWRQARPHASHKGRFGDVLVVGGAAGMQGAAVLAARAASHAGAGRVFVSSLAADMPPLSPELMWQPERMRDAHAVSQSTVVAGCGGSDVVAASLPMLLSRAPRLVLDADALNAIAADATLQSLLRQRSDRGVATVLTPHPLEAARLLGAASADAVQADRVQAANSIAARFGCCVVLKGSGTVIAAPHMPTAINPTGNGRLAIAGTGDVLAGWMAGRWSALPQAHPTAVAACAAWEHGWAAQLDAARMHTPLVASNLIDLLGQCP